MIPGVMAILKALGKGLNSSSNSPRISSLVRAFNCHCRLIYSLNSKLVNSMEGGMAVSGNSHSNQLQPETNISPPFGIQPPLLPWLPWLDLECPTTQ